MQKIGVISGQFVDGCEILEHVVGTRAVSASTSLFLASHTKARVQSELLLHWRRHGQLGDRAALARSRPGEPILFQSLSSCYQGHAQYTGYWPLCFAVYYSLCPF